MKAGSKSIVVVAALILSACGSGGVDVPTVHVPLPDIKLPKFNFNIDLSGLLPSCEKKQDPKAITPEALQNGIVISDTVPEITKEYVDCDGKSLRSKLSPERIFTREFGILPPTLEGDVNYVQIENNRSRYSRRLQAVANPPTPTQAPTDFLSSWVDRTYVLTSGEINIQVATVSPLLPVGGYSVCDGKNVLNITYYGQCMKMKPNSGECEEPVVLGKKSILVDVEIDRPQHPETKKTFKECSDSH